MIFNAQRFWELKRRGWLNGQPHFDDIMTCRMSFHKALKTAKEEYPERPIDDQKKIAKGIQIRSNRKEFKFKRMV